MNRLLIAALAYLLSVAGAAWWGYGHGDTAGQRKVQDDWDEATRLANADVARTRGAGFTLAEDLETKLSELEKRHDRTSAQLRAAQRLRVTCPASGEVGDLVLPAAVIRGMLGDETEPSAHPPRTAASGPPG